jgi:hypothetical protein
MNDIAEFLILVAAGIAVALLVYWHYARSRSILEEWAQQNGFEIVASEYRNFFKRAIFLE